MKIVKTKNNELIDSEYISYQKQPLKTVLYQNLVRTGKFENTIYQDWVRLAAVTGPLIFDMFISTGGGPYQHLLKLGIKSMSGYSQEIKVNQQGSTNGGYFSKLRFVYKGNNTCYIEGLTKFQNVSKDITTQVLTPSTIIDANIRLYNENERGSVPTGYDVMEVNL